MPKSINRIRNEINSGDVIPKPFATKNFLVEGWGKCRGSEALIYTIPNHKTPDKPYPKGVTVEEFEAPYLELEGNGKFTKKWLKQNLSECAKQGCNYTTIGGIFELLGLAQYSERGVYVKIK